MSGLDLDSLEKLLAEAKPAAPWREHKYGIIADGGDVVSWDYAWGENEHTEEWTLKPLIVAAVNALPALITRLRAAEARTAWQPIETAPKMEWVLARRENLHIPPVVVRRRDRKSPVTLLMDAAFYDDNGSRIRGLTHWSPIPTDATLPDAPEAP